MNETHQEVEAVGVVALELGINLGRRAAEKIAYVLAEGLEAIAVELSGLPEGEDKAFLEAAVQAGGALVMRLTEALGIEELDDDEADDEADPVGVPA